MRKNWNCDGDKCLVSEGEIRVLPTGGDSNLLLCRACYENEMRYRRERNLELNSAAQFALPAWDSLDVYGGAL